MISCECKQYFSYRGYFRHFESGNNLFVAELVEKKVGRTKIVFTKPAALLQRFSNSDRNPQVGYRRNSKHDKFHTIYHYIHYLVTTFQVDKAKIEILKLLIEFS